MEELENRIADLAVVAIAEHIYLSYQAVTDAVAAVLFPVCPKVRLMKRSIGASWKLRMKFVASSDTRTSPD